jgi:hypothetical protein
MHPGTCLSSRARWFRPGITRWRPSPRTIGTPPTIKSSSMPTPGSSSLSELRCRATTMTRSLSPPLASTTPPSRRDASEAITVKGCPAIGSESADLGGHAAPSAWPSWGRTSWNSGWNGASPRSTAPRHVGHREEMAQVRDKSAASGRQHQRVKDPWNLTQNR